ncbi:MAG: hypothetical protein IBJ04_06310 [Hydrogenophaga sp.]|uniref:Uncharacterized protein n=1 Tax=Hydrogenophaga crocea TaxID=2716225 RepID=A0A6G8IEU6_9BURK|nr:MULTISPECIES: hypothetical protein [Hydrogenophaga]MBL0943925.1 hypothetical protein [Hydrogenophaga sp.]QIM51546.1 hypothetical protein G9Q37_05030 [Hydrogenophaga crocea]
MRAPSLRYIWQNNLADVAAASQYPLSEVLAPHKEKQLQAMARDGYLPIALVDKRGQRAAAPYLEALRWSFDSQRLPLRAGAPVLEALARRFVALLGREAASEPPLGNDHTRRLRTLALCMRLFESMAPRQAKRVLHDLLNHKALAHPEPERPTLADIPALALCAWTIAWRRLLGSSPLYDVLLQAQTHAASLPCAERAHMLSEEAVLVCTLHLHERQRVTLARLADDAERQPALRPLLRHTQAAVAFLQSESDAGTQVDALLDHLLHEERLWTAADTLLLLHLAHLTTPLVPADCATLGGEDGLAMHFQSLHGFALGFADQGLQLRTDQAARVQTAAVALLRHLASLVPDGQPAEAPLVVGLLPHALRQAALARLSECERKRFLPYDPCDAGV